MPAASVAFTAKVWEPSLRLLRLFGELQLVKAAPSRLHWKVEFASLEEKSKLGEALLDWLVGLVSMVVSGATVSTVQVVEGGEASVLPAASVAFTEKVWGPSLRPVRLMGEVHSV